MNLKPYIPFEEFRERFPPQNHSSRVLPAVEHNHALFNIEASEYFIDFGSGVFGRSTLTHKITITNNGLIAIPIRRIKTEAPFDTSLRGPIMLWPTEELELTLSFSPTEPMEVEGKAILTFGLGFDTQTINLVGTGRHASLLLDGSWRLDGTQRLLGEKYNDELYQ